MPPLPRFPRVSAYVGGAAPGYDPGGSAIAVGPALIAFRCWGAGVQRAGPSTAAFFSNLTPLFAALLSIAFLGESPQAYHGIAFMLIVGGIIVSSRR